MLYQNSQNQQALKLSSQNFEKIFADNSFFKVQNEDINRDCQKDISKKDGKIFYFLKSILMMCMVIFAVGFVLWSISDIGVQTVVQVSKIEQNIFEENQNQENGANLGNHRLLNQISPSQNILQNTKQKISSVVSRTYQKLNLQANLSGIKQYQVTNALEFFNLKNTYAQSQTSQKERQYYEEKYNISKYPTEIPICVVVPSYNNIADDRYKANMNSILQQNYTNFHVVFIDDASTDQTYNKTFQLVQERSFPFDRIRMIRNQAQMFAMYNLRRAAMQFCKPEELYIIVDGDDQLIGRYVFKLYNALFQETGAYFVYTNFMTSRGIVGSSRPIPDIIKQTNNYRRYQFVISHLRAFYTKLFQLVHEQDLQDINGKYYRAANDVAICQPILQMCGNKVQYFPQITYLYNSQTGLNNHRIRTNQQKINDILIRKKKRYGQIDNLFETSE